MCKVNVLHNLVNKVRLQKCDLHIGDGINVEYDVVVKGNLVFNVKLGSDLCNCLVDFCVAWGVKDSVVHVDDTDEFLSIEHAFLHPGISESY